MSVVVSLTTIPPRFPHLRPVLEGLLNQSAAIDEIRLNIPHHYRRFPDYDGALPDVPDGIRVVQLDDDLGPATKVLPTARDLRGTGAKIIYCDDDRLYPPDQFARMLDASQERPGMCIATAARNVGSDEDANARGPHPRVTPYEKGLTYRVRRLAGFARSAVTRKALPKPLRPLLASSGFADIAMGYGAVLIEPEFFDDPAYDIPKVAWSVDDIWLSGQMARRGVQIWGASGFQMPATADGEDIAPLLHSVIDGAGRDDANQQCEAYLQREYGIWQS